MAMLCGSMVIAELWYCSVVDVVVGSCRYTYKLHKRALERNR